MDTPDIAPDLQKQLLFNEAKVNVNKAISDLVDNLPDSGPLVFAEYQNNFYIKAAIDYLKEKGKLLTSLGLQCESGNHQYFFGENNYELNDGTQKLDFTLNYGEYTPGIEGRTLENPLTLSISLVDFD